MIRTIAQKEFTTALRDRRFLLLGSIILLLLLTAALTGFSSYQLIEGQQKAAQESANESFHEQPDRHPHRVAHYGSYAFRPKPVLSFLDFGLDSFTGSMVYMEAHQQNSANFSQAQQSGSLTRFGEMTVAFVMQWLIPILIIFLCFNAFTQEKEEDMLKVLLSQGVSLRQVATAKIAGYSKVLALIVVPSISLAAVFLFKLNNFSWNTDLILRITVFIISYILYFFIFITGSVLISALSKHSRTALITLLGIWIFTCVLLPKAAANLGSSLYATPSKAEMDAEVHHEAKEGMNGHDPLDKRTADFKKALLLKYKVDSLSQLPVNADGLVMAEGEAFSSKVYQQHFEALVATYHKQDQIAVWAGFIDPYLAVRNLSMGMAGSDFAHYVDFLNAAEKYRYALAQFLNGQQATKMHYKDKETRLSREVWKKYPDFNYEMPGISWALNNQVIAVTALLCWTILIYFLSIFLIGNLKNV